MGGSLRVDQVAAFTPEQVATFSGIRSRAIFGQAGEMAYADAMLCEYHSICFNESKNAIHVNRSPANIDITMTDSDKGNRGIKLL